MLPRTLLPIVLLGSLSALDTARAWDDTGHQVVAAIAWSQLKPQVRDKIRLLFPDDLQSKDQVLFFRAHREPTAAEYSPHLNYNHITVANWMDDIRDDSNNRSLADWHYIDKPFFDGIEPRFVTPGAPNVREKILEMLGALRKLRHFDKADKDHAADDKAKAAYAIAVLFHLIGDIHQPLHCVSRFSPGLEDGDRGGNLFPIRVPNMPNLHYYWDAAGGLFDFVRLGRDFDAKQQEQLDGFVKRVETRWDAASHPEWKNFSPDEWVDEGYKLGKEQVYSGIRPETEPDAAYSEKTKQICAGRIAIAGYRLALALNEILAEP